MPDDWIEVPNDQIPGVLRSVCKERFPDENWTAEHIATRTREQRCFLGPTVDYFVDDTCVLIVRLFAGVNDDLTAWSHLSYQIPERTLA